MNFVFILTASIILKIVITYDLSGNVVVNGDFSLPQTSTLMYAASIPGWNCLNLCQINSCDHFNAVSMRNRFVGSDCSEQMIDLDSNYFFETITQTVEMKAGLYLLSVAYLYPYKNTDKKTLEFYFNNQLVFSLSPQVSASFEKKLAYVEIHGREGSNNLSFAMKGTIAPDASGFKIIKIDLQRIIHQTFQLIIDSAIINPINLNMLGLPGSRVFFGQIMHFFVSFDRLQFYFAHQRIKGYYDEMFVDNINKLFQVKGTLIQDSLKHVLTYLTKEEETVTTFDQKKEYTNPFFLKKNANGDGFILNNDDLVIYSLPFLALAQLAFYLAFLYLSESKMAKFMRKYYLFGLFILLICEGNIEQFTFFMFSEFSKFFSLSFRFKIINLCLLLFFCFVVMTSCSFFFLSKYHYKKAVRVLIEQTNPGISGVFCSSLDKGIICFLFGMAHQILLNYPMTQLLVLGLLEVLWICSRVAFLRKRTYKYQIVTMIDILLSINTMAYQVGCFLFLVMVDRRDFINDNYQIYVILVFIGLWLLQILTLVVYFVLDVHIITNSIKGNRVAPAFDLKQRELQYMQSQRINCRKKSRDNIPSLNQQKEKIQSRTWMMVKKKLKFLEVVKQAGKMKIKKKENIVNSIQEHWIGNHTTMKMKEVFTTSS